ncbi:MAG: hypothetical protein BGO89_06260 [Candidatus Kapaibacterium thiocyanatum]|uniref:Uncharacterized protein n=1 Tax=Candidatus Kapaibacterium thiocyanatum TaxID=1895771 RepID=A0A1M3KYI4_9BACT|nr:MAG: hypothetical protein BGO89_06260 ['Candidatus Kapabacteria' thiocyanatum]
MKIDVGRAQVLQFGRSKGLVDEQAHQDTVTVFQRSWGLVRGLDQEVQIVDRQQVLELHILSWTSPELDRTRRVIRADTTFVQDVVERTQGGEYLLDGRCSVASPKASEVGKNIIIGSRC